MKLLILTQKIDADDDLLGFFHAWAAEFARQCEKITIIALGIGEYDLPNNVQVLSLGKEAGRSRLKYLFRFYRYIWQERKNYDAVFVHMNTEYVILGGVIWRLMAKRIALWYVHKRADFKLRLAAKLANVIFTASLESFRLSSAKLKIIGHGIDLPKFDFAPGAKNGGDFKIIYVGRISKIKNQRLLIEAMNILVNERKLHNILVDFIGGQVYSEDKIYQKELADLVKKNQLQTYINFTGSVPYKDMPAVYRAADMSINLCPTGGLDKAVLESMAAGLPIIAFNKGFAFLRDICENLILEETSAGELADKICAWINLTHEESAMLGRQLRDKVAMDHDLVKLVNNIINELSR